MRLAIAVAHRRVVEAHRAGAAAIFAAAQALAQRLDHLLAGLVARLAADANAVRRHFACAMAASEITLAKAHAVPATANRAETTSHRAAEILQRLASDTVFANAVNLAAVGTLFNADLALRNDTARIVRRGVACRGHRRLSVRGANCKRAVFQQSIHDPSFLILPQTFGSPIGIAATN